MVLSGRSLRVLLPAACLVAGASCGRGSRGAGTAVPPGSLALDPGDGHDGPLTISSAGMVVNACAPVTDAAGATVHVATGGGIFHAGDRVLIWQVQDAFADVQLSTDPPLDEPDLANAGLFEIGTVASIDPAASTLTLAAPLAWTYASAAADAGARAQACALPQFSSVTVLPGGSITANAWDGESGGLVAFFVSGTLSLQGSVLANGDGFRGGSLSSDLDAYHVTIYDTTMGQGGGKGESLDGRARSMAGRGDIGNGGGGGNAHNAGGGGGGNGGRGGLGGREYGNPSDPKTQGLPGAPLVPPPTSRLALGGGGGAGQQNNDLAGIGGNGGGVVLVVAGTLEGDGVVSASGGAGHDAGDADHFGDGGGGGGAGGSILLEAIHDTFTGTLVADGGRGGDVLRDGQSHGPGGGGGGGRLAARISGIGVTTSVVGGDGGTNANNGADPWGATAGEPGRVDLVPPDSAP